MSVTNRLYKIIERGKEGSNKGLSTGLPKLDKIIYGIQRRCFTTIGGDTGSGKSTLALYMYVYRPLTEMLENGEDVQVLYFSFEMSAEVLFAKLLSLRIFDKYKRIITYESIMSLTAPISDEDYHFVEKAKEWLETVEERISIVDKALSPDQIEDVLRQFHEALGKFKRIDDISESYTPENPLGYRIVVLDHAGLINGPNKPSIDATCETFIKYRNMCSMTGVFVQQLNRNFKDMARKNSVYDMVQLNDFADSSGPAQGSEIVIALFDANREKKKTCQGYDISALEDRFRAILVLKNRFGLSNKLIGVNFFGEIGYWRELPKANEINDYGKYLYLLKKDSKEEKDVPNKEIVKKKEDSKMNIRLTLD